MNSEAEPRQGRKVMQKGAATALMLITLATTSASAQVINLTGRWQCTALCLGPPGGFGFITQNGWDLNVVNDIGAASRAWVDYPGHIWLERANVGAVYSPDGIVLQFDNGTVWQRAPELPPGPPPPLRTRG
jgi:hypothetical protein